MFQKSVYWLLLVLLGVAPTSGVAASAMQTPELASGVLYLADSTTGFDDWPQARGWVTVSDMLVNDGSDEIPKFLPAPVELQTPNYAVEVELQRVRDGNSFGVVVRGGDHDGYWVGYGNPCHDVWTPAIWAGQVPRDPRNMLCGLEASNMIYGTNSRNFDKEWHQLRIEVEGNSLRVFVDGGLEIEITDNAFLAPGQVGLWSSGAQVSVRSFTVIALD